MFIPGYKYINVVVVVVVVVVVAVVVVVVIIVVVVVVIVVVCTHSRDLGPTNSVTKAPVTDGATAAGTEGSWLGQKASGTI